MGRKGMEDSSVKLKDKMSSRTWIITIFWSIFMVAAFVLQAFTKLELPLGQIVTFTGTVTVAYLGKRSVQEWRRNGSGRPVYPERADQDTDRAA